MKAHQAITTCGVLLVAVAHARGQATFTKITNGAIVTDRATRFTGSAWGDFNNDGYLDLFVCTYEGTNILYLNHKDGTFTKVVQGPAFQDVDAHLGAAIADYNNDGNLDLLVAAGGASDVAESPVLYQGHGDGTLTPSSISVNTPSGFFWAATWADYDNDGFADLFITDEGNSQSTGGKNMLLHNEGNGSFSRVSSGTIVNDITASRCALWADYDNDGLMDLLVINGAPRNNPLYHNDGHGAFTRVLTNAIATDQWPSGANHAAWGDYDNDGLLDLFVTGADGTARLYHNNGNGSFTNVTSIPMVSLGLPAGATANGAAWGDYDNDGYLDLVVTCIGAPTLLFHNNGDGTFTKILTGSEVSDGGSGIYTATCSWVDYDNDGFLDLFLTRNTQGAYLISNLLYHNDGNTNAWLEVKLVGSVSNRSAIGAKVRVRATIGGKTFWQMREINTGGGWDVVPLVAHFGLGNATNIEVIRIEWPSGTVQELDNRAPRQILTVTEPPQLKIAAPTAADSLQLSLIGIVGSSYELQTSSDLNNWTHWTTLTSTNRTTTLTDSIANTSSARFYRALMR
jgi:hypothetical protein